MTASIFSILLLPAAPAQEAKKQRQHEPLNKKFEDPKLDVDGFVKRFESESREVAAKRDEVIALCKITPGMSVADIGAGTGLYTFPFADKVGKGGSVYAVDISPAFLKYLEAQAAKRGLEKVVKPVAGSQTSTNLAKGSVDLVFICDAYHHFEHPAPMLKSIHQALRAGGRVVIIDFDKRPDASAFIKNHARAEKEVYFKEFESAGFKQVDVKHAPKFKENFTAVFEKPR
jgi:ubiquinone/menaquinone biosynthesis C-methylase UbiE